jgi:hypothetical protein
VLADAGLFGRIASGTFEDVADWPYPVLVRLRPHSAAPQEHWAILCGSNEAGLTLIDPNPFGRLLPMPPSEFRRRWTGDAVFTSPVPFRAMFPWGSLAASAGVLALGGLICMRMRGAAVCLLASLAVLAGCSKPGSTAGTATVEGHVSIEPAHWNLGDVFAGPTSGRVELHNRGPRSVRVDRVMRSCGCMASGLYPGADVPASGSHEFDLRVDFAGQAGPVTHTIDVWFTDGSMRRMTLTANVLRGVYAEPSELRVVVPHPAQLVVETVALVADDGSEFDVTGATADAAALVEAVPGERTVRVTYAHRNDTEHLRDTLVITTSHPHSGVVKVPVGVRNELTWAVDPPVLFAAAGAESEHTVTVRSTRGESFVVLAGSADGHEVTPLSTSPATSQVVRVRVTTPATLGMQRRWTLPLHTTIPDAPVIEVAVISARSAAR